MRVDESGDSRFAVDDLAPILHETVRMKGEEAFPTDASVSHDNSDGGAACDSLHPCIYDNWPREWSMRAPRFARKLALPATIAIKHQFRMWLDQDEVKKAEVDAEAEALRGQHKEKRGHKVIRQSLSWRASSSVLAPGRLAFFQC